MADRYRTRGRWIADEGRLHGCVELWPLSAEVRRCCLCAITDHLPFHRLLQSFHTHLRQNFATRV